MFDGCVVFVVGKHEVEDADHINGVEFEIPSSFEGLVLDGESGIEQTSILEKILFGLLDFDDKSFPCRAGAVEVENRLSIGDGSTEFFYG